MVLTAPAMEQEYDEEYEYVYEEEEEEEEVLEKDKVPEGSIDGSRSKWKNKGVISS